MQRIKIGLGLAALLAMSAIGTGTASAKSPKLDLTFDGQQVPTRELLELTSSEFTLTSPHNGGTMMCLPLEPPLGGLETNDAPKDEMLLIPTSGASRILCRNSVTGAFGELVIGPVSPASPWLLILKSSGKAELTSNSTEPISVKVLYEAPSYAFCHYTSKKLKGSLNTGTVRPMEIFLSQKLKLSTADSSAGCPKAATFTWPLLASYKGFPVFANTEA